MLAHLKSHHRKTVYSLFSSLWWKPLRQLWSSWLNLWGYFFFQTLAAGCHGCFLFPKSQTLFWIQNCFQVHNDCRRHYHENWSSKSLWWRRIWQKSKCADDFITSEQFQRIQIIFFISQFPHFQMLLLRFRRFSQISACGYFTVDRSLVTSFLGTTFTYWVILVQFTQTVENWRNDLNHFQMYQIFDTFENV